ncbi:hypothetical protein L3i22_098390 [Actinoplanes sp. L3-i22]|nr:hypothetical protein L3i22_098390 [Actinoplanes sp. L3-i22]
MSKMRSKFAGVLMAAPMMLGAVAVTTTMTSAPAFADASCTGNVSVYGTLADGRLTYSVIDPDNGNLTHVVSSTATLGFTPKTIATLNFNTVLITSTGGTLYRVDITTNSDSLVFSTPVALGGGWTHDLLTYDGHGHLYGIAAGTLIQYVVSRDKPGTDQIGQRKVIGTGFTLKTLAGAGDDRIVGTTSDGQLLSYAIPDGGTWVRSQLDDRGWQSFANLLSPGGGLYYGKNPDGAMYWYEDQNPTDGSGSDITYHLDDPVASRGWTQNLLSASPETCTYKAPVNPLRSKIVTAANAEVGTPESNCTKYGSGCGEIAWCAMFAKWVWKQAGVSSVPSTNFARGLGAWGQSNGLFKSRSGSAKGSPKIGDWVIYGTPEDASGGHVQIITAVHPDGTLTVVGGNQSDAVRKSVIDPDTARSGADDLAISGYVTPPGA